MPRRAICLCLMLAISLVGCTTVPEVKYAADPMTGEVFEYTDSRTWLERHSVVELPVVTLETIEKTMEYGLYAFVFAISRQSTN